MKNGVLKCNNEPFRLDKHFQNFPLVRPECLGSPQKGVPLIGLTVLGNQKGLFYLLKHKNKSGRDIWFVT